MYFQAASVLFFDPRLILYYIKSDYFYIYIYTLYI